MRYEGDIYKVNYRYYYCALRTDGLYVVLELKHIDGKYFDYGATAHSVKEESAEKAVKWASELEVNK